MTFSAPSQAYLLLAGLLEVVYIFCNSDSKNVLPQLASTTIKMFLNFPLPLVRSFHMAAENATDSTLFLWRTSRAQRYQLPEHPSMQSFSRVSGMISIRCFCCLWILVAAFSIFQVVVMRSCRALEVIENKFFEIFLPFSKLSLCLGHQFFLSFDVTSYEEFRYVNILQFFSFWWR